MRQWPGNGADLDFRPVVKEARAFLLCARHVQEVAALSTYDAMDGEVPALAFFICAFFRVWCVVSSSLGSLTRCLPHLWTVGCLRRCVVELAAAAAFQKNVIMLVGQASEEGLAFVPNTGMISNLFWLVDVRKAVASVPKDKT